LTANQRELDIVGQKVRSSFMLVRIRAGRLDLLRDPGVQAYVRGPARGQFFYLYLVVDVWSRMIMAWEVAEEESSEIASRMIGDIVNCCGREGERIQVLHIWGGIKVPPCRQTLVVAIP
jgi:hypothetical protein